MQYVDYDYYITEYGGKVPEDDFTRYLRKAERRIDYITSRKLQLAFPEDENDAAAVKDTICELAEFMYRVDLYANSAMDSAGVVTQEDGTVKGKVVTSISSGSESISYSASGSASTSVMEAAKDKKVAESAIYSIVSTGLGGIPDNNGVNLLFAGEYPRAARNKCKNLEGIF